jgi:hypothetical protein
MNVMGKLEVDFKKIGMRNEGVPLGSKFSIFGVPGVPIGSNLFTKKW